MNIQWTNDHPEAEFSSRTGIDEAGNRYHEDAAREVVSCTMPDGRTGTDWTPEKALRNAENSKPITEDWKICPAGTKGDFLLIVDGSRAIATIHAPSRFAYSIETGESIARMIASAPRILSSAKALIDRLDSMTSAEFEKGGERIQREALRTEINKSERTTA